MGPTSEPATAPASARASASASAANRKAAEAAIAARLPGWRYHYVPTAAQVAVLRNDARAPVVSENVGAFHDSPNRAMSGRERAANVALATGQAEAQARKSLAHERERARKYPRNSEWQAECADAIREAEHVLREASERNAEAQADLRAWQGADR